MTIEPNEAYAGPQYGEPVAHAPASTGWRISPGKWAAWRLPFRCRLCSTRTTHSPSPPKCRRMNHRCRPAPADCRRSQDPAASTRQITLMFSDPRRPASQGGMTRFSGTSTVVCEDFPQLLDAITMNSWASQLINYVECTNPSTIRESADRGGWKLKSSARLFMTNVTCGWSFSYIVTASPGGGTATPCIR